VNFADVLSALTSVNRTGSKSHSETRRESVRDVPVTVTVFGSPSVGDAPSVGVIDVIVGATQAQDNE